MLSSFIAFADDKYHNFLTGDWKGNRSKFSELGLDFTVTSQNNFDNNFSGGIKKGHGLLNINNFKINIDAEKLFSLSGTNAQISFVKTTGVKPNQKWVGSLVQVDNNETVASLAKLQEAWVSKQFDKHNVLFGFYNLADDFFLLNTGNLFIATNYSSDVDIPQFAVDNNFVYSPSLYPTTSLGSRIKIQLHDYLYLQTAISDLVTQSATNINYLHKKINKNNGLFAINQIGSNSKYGNYFLRCWFTSKRKYSKFANQNKLVNNNGYYLGLEKNIYSFNSKQLMAFYRFGKANRHIVLIKYASAFGLVVNNIFQSRDSSQFGLGFSKTTLSQQYLNSLTQNSQKSKKTEKSFEITYKENLLPWLQIQPDFQYIIKPSLHPVDIDSTYPKNAFVGILALTINF